ncbi:MAG: putative DNA-binding domain-containing protein [Ignavibacteriales bacterium]|nr:putative DNA-binding domain-containing protein [Ignavibacteriales bacterium]
MQLSNYTQTQQNNFANFCKTTELKQIDGLTENRIDHYRRLIYGVIDDSLRSTYPLTENLLEEDEWQYLVDNFIEKHNCQSPKIWQMPFEFYEFINENEFNVKIKYPHLIDLLLFEWKEIEIYMMEDLNDNVKNTSSEINESSNLIINNEHEIIELSYPVHLKSAKEISANDAGNYFVLIFRADDKVQFYDVAQVFVWFIHESSNNLKNISDVIEEAIKLNVQVEKEIIKQNLLSFISTMHTKGFILGFKNSEIKND